MEKELVARITTAIQRYHATHEITPNITAHLLAADIAKTLQQIEPWHGQTTENGLHQW